MSISLRSNPDGSGTLLNGSTPVMEITAAGVVSLPNIAAGSSANHAVNLGQVLGVGQTWQDVTASRSAGVTYTNTTGKSILFMYGAGSHGSGGSFSMTINGVSVAASSWGSSVASGMCATYLIPSGGTYVYNPGGYTVNVKISELRG